MDIYGKPANTKGVIIGLAVVVAIGAILAQRQIRRPNKLPTPNIPLPIGYTLENYSVEKITGGQCSKHTECQTPPEYMAMSRCPFVSLCLKNQCAVVCPAHK